jgi:glycosyltransferase involved in cell wall biosynthesis
LDRPLPPAGKPGRFLVVADLVDRTKNVSGVLNALAVARRELPKLSLTIIGDGPDRPQLEQQVEQLGLGGQVGFLGRLPNADVLDQVADAFAMVVNSNVETFSVVTGEALAQGRPVIATRCGGPTAFVNATNGILIEPRDDAALARAMVQLTKDADRYEPVTIRAGVNDRFSPDAVGRRFADIYARILGRP